MTSLPTMGQDVPLPPAWASVDTARDAPDNEGAEPVPPAVVDVLHCLGYLYLRHGQARRAAALLMVAGRAAPARPDLLRTLALALIEAGLGDHACDVLDRLAGLDPQGAGHRMVRLMRARALELRGRDAEARALFSQLGAA